MAALLRPLLRAALAACLVAGTVVQAQPAPAAPAGAAPAEYRIGSGDVVRITVFQNPDLTLETRITEAGVINYPLLGNIRLGGLTVTAAEKLVADGLRNGNFIKQPQVSMVVLQVRGNQASVLGLVNRPGRYPIEVADMRLTDLIATAGGTSPGGADLVVVVGTREGKPFRVEVDVPTLFAPGGREKDITILNGDTVWVDRQPLVYIYGEVQRPGAMRLERDMTLLQVLATGGGLTPRGTDGRAMVLELRMDERMLDGDVVYVRESLF